LWIGVALVYCYVGVLLANLKAERQRGFHEDGTI